MYISVLVLCIQNAHTIFKKLRVIDKPILIILYFTPTMKMLTLLHYDCPTKRLGSHYFFSWHWKIFTFTTIYCIIQPFKQQGHIHCGLPIEMNICSHNEQCIFSHKGRCRDSVISLCQMACRPEQQLDSSYAKLVALRLKLLDSVMES